MLLQMVPGRFKGARTALGWKAGGRVAGCPACQTNPRGLSRAPESGSHQGPFLREAPSNLLLLCQGAKSMESLS